MRNKLKIRNLILPLIGLVTLVWFLIRVIPKPSRASYPCMKASAPFASSFVLYIIGLGSSVFIFRKSGEYFRKSKYILFAIALSVSIVLGFSSYFGSNTENIYANTQQSTLEGPNLPMGEGKGVCPGRVAWIYNPDATDEACTNQPDDFWYLSYNTKQEVVNQMFKDGILMMTNTTTEEVAWDSIFHYYNRTHGRGNIGYTAGEKIVMKINLNSCSYCGGSDESTQKCIDTSPQIVAAILNSLVSKAGVAQANITFGDPGRTISGDFWGKYNVGLKSVKYWGMVPATLSSTFIYTSDGTTSAAIPQDYVDAKYMINVPVLKKHHRAGISLTSKNHFGTIVASQGSAFGWHFSLPCSEGMAQVTHGKYGEYRCFVDIMGHKDLGGKTILYVIDGIWGSTNWAHPPIKWRMNPFNNDYPNSLFLSQDPVAIESVGFDFLYNEFGADHPTEGHYDDSDNKGPFSHYPAADDFLHQAADSANWAKGIKYDPEKDGTFLPKSMGTHEHWNNAINKMYSRNLGLNKGIELVSNAQVVSVKNIPSKKYDPLGSYPNPFNSATTICYTLLKASKVTITIYDVKGNIVRTLIDAEQKADNYELVWDGRNNSKQVLPKGVYFGKMIARDNDVKYQIMRMVLN